MIRLADPAPSVGTTELTSSSLGALVEMAYGKSEGEGFNSEKARNVWKPNEESDTLKW